MIDGRFPPQPTSLAIPLYPHEGDVRPHLRRLLGMRYSRKAFTEWLSAAYGVEPFHIHLANRASSSLCLFLQWFKTQTAQPLKVAIPAYCCPDVCQALLTAGAEPLFFEMTPNLSLSRASIKYAKERGCQILIFPQLFGARPFPQEARRLLRELDILFIDDEAQSFPRHEAGAADADLSLFSFGKSKRLAGIGGGGLCLHRTDFAKKFLDFALKHPLPEQKLLKASTLLFHACSRPLARRLGRVPALESDLKRLLEKNPFSNRPLILGKFDDFSLQVAEYRRQTYRRGELIRRAAELKEAVASVWGMHACSLLSGIEEPSVFAIRAPSGRRYALASLLAERGVQTTWYYYPLNRLRFLTQFDTENTPHSEVLANEILILPFQSGHSKRHFDLLIQAITQVKL